jgi:hypothetical protein
MIKMPLTLFAVGLVAILGMSTVPAAPAHAADVWGTPITISGTSVPVSEPQIVSNGSIMNAVWVAGKATGTDTTIQTARSIDNGLTWIDPTALADVVTDRNSEPQIATSGTIVTVVWKQTTNFGNTFINVKTSRDNGENWGATVLPGSAEPGPQETPQVVIHGGEITAIWVGPSGSGDSDGVVHSKTTTGGGVTWPTGKPVIVSDLRTGGTGAANSTVAASPQIVSDGTTLTAIWTRKDGSAGDTVVQTKTSTDGITWSTATDLSDAPTNAIPQLALNGTKVTAIWQKTVGSQNGIVTASSNDDGTWPTTVARVDFGDGANPQLVAYGTTVTAAWLYLAVPYTRSSDAGAAWSTPVAFDRGTALTGTPQLASNGTTVTMVWNNPSNDSIQARVSGDKGITWGAIATLVTSATGVAAPQVVANGTRYTAIWAAGNSIQVTSLSAGGTPDPGADPSAPAQPELADTGAADTVVWVSIGVSLLLGGVLLAIIARRQRRRA